MLVSSTPSAPSPALIATGACEVGELQEMRMLNYRAALETSNSSGTVARRGGSRAVNRNCGGSRGEQSEGSFCACIAPSPSLPLSFSHLSRPPRPPARTGVRESAPRRGWEAAAPEAEEPPWVEKGVCKVSSIRGHLPWKCARVKGPLWPARRPRQDGRGAKSPRLPTSEEAVGCQMSVFLPGVKPLLPPHPAISVTASSTAARALLSVFCKGLFKNVETNIPQELNISPRGEDKSYKNIYHSAQGQGREKSETERGSRREDGGEEGSRGRTRPSGEGRTREERGERNSRRGEITGRETMVQDRSGKRENSGRGKTTGKKE